MITTNRPVSEVKSDIITNLHQLRDAVKKPGFTWSTVEPLFQKLEASIDNGFASFETS